MAVNLKAVATLNTKPYMASLSKLSAGTAKLNTTAVRGSKAVVDAQDREIAAHKRGAQRFINNTRTMANSSRRALANAQTGYNNLSSAQSRAAQTGTQLAQSLSSQRYLYQDMSRYVARTSLAFAAVPIAAVAAGTAWEKSFADVVRTADPDLSKSSARVEQLRVSLRDMVQTLPTSWGNVTEIATLANQMGIAAENTASFTRAVTMFAATSGVSVDTAATAFGRLQSIVPDVNGDFVGLSDSILKVGVESVATEEEIINVVTQISSIAGAAGFSSKEMIGLSGAMASVRVPPELSRGVVTRVFGTISRAASNGGAALEGVAKVAGMSADEFQQAWGNEGKSGRAFLAFVEGLRRLGPAAEAELRGLGITSVRDVPVMLRLANARGSDGVQGILRQAMDDAENASGETQRQYTIMADTVAAKLKIAGNNIVAFFNEIGKGSLGPIGDILDNFSKTLSDVTNSLDDTAKLFGKFDLPITNGELIGWVTLLGAASASVLALGAGFLKFRQGVVGAKQLGAALFGLGSAAKQARFDTSGFVMMENSAKKSSSAIGRSFNTIKEGAKGMGKGVVAAGAGIGAAARLAFNPWVLLSGLALGAIASFLEGTKGASTEVSDLAEDIANLSGGPQAIKNIEIGELFGGTVKPLEDGLGSLKKLQAEIDKTTQSQVEMSAAPGMEGAYISGLSKRRKATKEYNEALELTNDAYKELSAAGNSGVGLNAILRSTEDFNGLMDDLNSGKLNAINRDLKAAFDAEGIRYSAKGLEQLSRGQLPELMGRILGVSEAVDMSSDALEHFTGGGSAGFSAMVNTAEEVARGFINVGEAVKQATSEAGNFSMEDFNLGLEEQIQVQENWSKNLVTAAKIGGTEFVQALLDIGTDAQKPLEEIVKDFEANGGKLSEAGQKWVDNLIRSTETGASEMGVAVAAAIDNISARLEGSNMGEKLADILSPEQLQSFSTSLEYVGEDAANRIANGLLSNKYSVSEALGLLAIESELEVNADFNVEPAKESLYLLMALGEGTVTTMQIDALPDLAEGKIWDVVELASGEVGFVAIDAETGEAVDGIAHVKDEAGNTVGTIKLTAQELEALAKIRKAKDKADDTKGTMKVDADASDAYAALEDLDGRVVTSWHQIVTERVESGQQSGNFWMNTGAGASQGGFASGAIVDYYADGGIRSRHIAQVAPPGAMRVWAEPETEGEAYIPFARSKRTRSVAILDQVAQRFGYSLTNATNVARFADGGQYMAQAMSRSRVSYVTGGSGRDASRVRIDSVVFSADSQKNQFREFTRYVDKYSRGLK